MCTPVCECVIWTDIHDPDINVIRKSAMTFGEIFTRNSTDKPTTSICTDIKEYPRFFGGKILKLVTTKKMSSTFLVGLKQRQISKSFKETSCPHQHESVDVLSLRTNLLQIWSPYLRTTYLRMTGDLFYLIS